MKRVVFATVALLMVVASIAYAQKGDREKLSFAARAPDVYYNPEYYRHNDPESLAAVENGGTASANSLTGKEDALRGYALQLIDVPVKAQGK